jgi:Lsr2
MAGSRTTAASATRGGRLRYPETPCRAVRSRLRRARDPSFGGRHGVAGRRRMCRSGGSHGDGNDVVMSRHSVAIIEARIGIPEGVGPCQGDVRVGPWWFVVVGVLCAARVAAGAGVKAGRRPPRRGLALTPARGGAGSGSHLSVQRLGWVGVGVSHRGPRRRTGGAGAATKAANKTVAAKTRRRRPGAPDTAAVREWARAHGHAVSDRGRIPRHIVEAFTASE